MGGHRCPRKPWGMGQGQWGGCQGFLRFALLGQKCLKQWGTCHPTLTLSLPQPPTHTHRDTHTYTHTGRQCYAAHQGVSCPCCPGVLTGVEGLEGYLLSPVHVPALPLGSWAAPAVFVCLYPLSLLGY